MNLAILGFILINAIAALQDWQERKVKHLVRFMALAMILLTPLFVTPNYIMFAVGLIIIMFGFYFKYIGSGDSVAMATVIADPSMAYIFVACMAGVYIYSFLGKKEKEKLPFMTITASAWFTKLLLSGLIGLSI